MTFGVTGINGATSFGVLTKLNTPKTEEKNLQSEVASDGYSAGQANDLNLMKPGATPGQVTLQVPVSALATQAFQQSLAALSASGIPVQVVLVAEQSMSGAAADKLASLEKRVNDFDQQLGYISGQQNRLERTQDSLVRNDERQDRDLGNLRSQLGMIADDNKPAPPVYTPPVHRAPSYGSD